MSKKIKKNPALKLVVARIRHQDNRLYYQNGSAWKSPRSDGKRLSDRFILK